MKKIEILLSVMHQKDNTIAKELNADTDILVINQCDEEKYEEDVYNGNIIRMIYTTQRGLSKSRNMALKNAKGDICIICDEGEKYLSGYKEAVQAAYTKHPEAAIIAFNIDRKGERGSLSKCIKKFAKCRRNETFCSVNLTFQRDIIVKHNITFNEKFGSGSGKISCGEEALWQRNAKRKKLKIYKNPFTIAESNKINSTWFTGYDERFFYDKGFYVAESMPKLKHFIKYYFVLRLLSVCDLSLKKQIKSLNMGINGHKHNLSYYEYIRKYK